MQCFFKRGFLLFLALITLHTAKAQADDLCDPMVEPIIGETTVAGMLTVLAKKYNFSLSFPENMNQPVHIEEKMKLSQLIKLLTTDMNTALLHEKIKDCTGPKLTELTVMPVGEETEYISVKQRAAPKNKTYIYIENIEQYATEVLMGERRAKVGRMTPEQRIEFKTVKKRLRKELKGEIKKNRKDKKRKKKKEKEQKF